jgi:hypothetical protein
MVLCLPKYFSVPPDLLAMQKEKYGSGTEEKAYNLYAGIQE